MEIRNTGSNSIFGPITANGGGFGGGGPTASPSNTGDGGSLVDQVVVEDMPQITVVPGMMVVLLQIVIKDLLEEMDIEIVLTLVEEVVVVPVVPVRMHQEQHRIMVTPAVMVV